jgi:hypothetical protein
VVLSFLGVWLLRSKFAAIISSWETTLTVTGTQNIPGRIV